MSQTIDQVFRDFNTDNVPASGDHWPDKKDIRALLKLIQNSGGQSITRNTLAALNGVTPPNENYMGVVLTGAGAGYYSRTGGVWVFGRPFPDTIAGVTLSGSGTAQTGTPSPGVNPASVLVYFAEVTTPNTAPLKLTIGGVQRDVVNAAGNPLSAGEWTGGVQFRINPDGKFQLVNDAGAAHSAAQSASEARAWAEAAGNVAIPSGSIDEGKLDIALVEKIGGKLDKDGSNIGDEAAQAAFRQSVGALQATYAPAGHHFGLTLVNDATDAINDYVLSAGEGASIGAQPVLIKLSTPVIKRFDAAWSAGTGNGGRFTSSSGDGFYYVWLIRNPANGLVDWGYSTSKVDPTSDAKYPVAFTQFHYCGAVLRESGAFVLIRQVGNRFVRVAAAANDGSAITGSTTIAHVVVTAPPGAVAMIRARMSAPSSTASIVFGDGDRGLSLGSTEASLAAVSGQVASGEFFLRTNASRQIAHRGQGGVASATFSLYTHGWIDDAIGSAGSPLSSNTLRAVACAVRYNGSAWEFIEDVNHAPVGVSSVTRVAVSGGFALQIAYDFSASKVAGLICGPDETFAGTYHVGASVGLTFSNMYIRNGSGALVDPNSVGVGGNFWIMGTMIS